MASSFTAPYGTWPSPLTARRIAAGALRLEQIAVDGGDLYWLESRPGEGGRGVLLRRRGGTVETVTPEGWSVRSRVHEYGGGSFLVHAGTVYFTREGDQRLYRQAPGEAPAPLTPEPEIPGGVRFADGVATPDGRWIVCVRERHDADGTVTNDLAAVATDGSGKVRPLTGGRDFYAFPRLDPDGGRLAFTCWDHPDMPWTGTELWLGNLGEGPELADPRHEAGGPGESIFQPAFDPNGDLHFISDRTGWWNLYRRDPAGTAALAPVARDMGAAQWGLGLSTYAFLPDGAIACLYYADGLQRLGRIPPEGGGLEAMDRPWTAFVPAQLVRCGEGLAYISGGPVDPPSVRTFDPAKGVEETVRESADLPLEAEGISLPEPMAFDSGGEESYALFYPPCHPEISAPPTELPPLITVVHGGPTAITECQLKPAVQFWTSRGFAVVEVNYAGSTGFGRAYRERLREAWGLADVADCCAAARHLFREGKADPERAAIRGGSAGGLTVLGSLATRDGPYSAGATYYGVVDLETLRAATHKYESRYLDWLIGPWPETRQRYRDRSPVNWIEQVQGPILILQGGKDRVVPPDQAHALRGALESAGKPYAYLEFPEERHGFRKAETLRRALEAELDFYSRVFGFEPADSPEPVEIRAPDSPA